MTERDKIREHVKLNYVDVARGKGQTCVSVIVRDIDRELGLGGNVRNICETLRRPEILAYANINFRGEVKCESVKLDSSTNVFVFDWK